ncbi:hypothetical protein D3C87_1252690 [compost metagenome]|uniref:DUF2501 domain-containing protein n=1 Tax=Cupriavidus campinensis TaxID=151783 RepID=A0AAE9IAA4_9BURK|nr:MULTISPECIES: DUF2501 domain-containing protein [Cupriavidus]TSP12605.1 DUF2501 domain-containing protein [Cupriavidus campinensis]URF06981.1 DUF2501 domain-containing protein [Cupriavidus campinensis]CAG2131329.1 hypothetical protein LMG19282_00445 [Cupriavidus campinensis]
MAKISVPATLRRAAWLTLPACGVALSAFSGVAHAQLGDLMKSAPSGGLGGISGLSMSSLSAGSAGNAAGVIEYCMKNNYLNADSATSAVKDKLLGSVPGGSKDAGYSDGSRGVLSTSNGRQLDLSNTAGIKAEVTKQVCDKILAQGKSML